MYSASAARVAPNAGRIPDSAASEPAVISRNMARIRPRRSPATPTIARRDKRQDHARLVARDVMQRLHAPLPGGVLLDQTIHQGGLARKDPVESAARDIGSAREVVHRQLRERRPDEHLLRRAEDARARIWPRLVGDALEQGVARTEVAVERRSRHAGAFDDAVNRRLGVFREYLAGRVHHLPVDRRVRCERHDAKLDRTSCPVKSHVVANSRQTTVGAGGNAGTDRLARSSGLRPTAKGVVDCGFRAQSIRAVLDCSCCPMAPRAPCSAR